MITGLGTIGPAGQGSDALAAALAAGVPLATPVDRAAGYHREEGARLAATVKSRDLSRWVSPVAARRMSFPSRLAVAAGRMALEDAGLDTGRAGSPRIGTYVATTFGSVLTTEKLLRLILLEGAEAAQPFLFSECVANAIAAQLAITVGARGPNVTLTQREAGPLMAVARAAQAVSEGVVDVALAGAVEEITPLLHAMLDRFDALAKPNGSHPERPRPFDRRRDGFLAGEGATILVIEREKDAAKRDARILARVGWSGFAFDATAGVSDWGHGDAWLSTILREGLASLQGGASRVGAIVSGASGSRRGDCLEARVLRGAWEAAPLPPVLTPKAVLGEYGGGILAPAILALAGAPFGALAEPHESDADLDMSPCMLGRDSDRSPVLMTGLAAGGAAAWLILEGAA